jgi:hypothetical protein
MFLIYHEPHHEVIKNKEILKNGAHLFELIDKTEQEIFEKNIIKKLEKEKV